jgi:glycosyltransferase involved in cell wall biosynthesis
MILPSVSHESFGLVLAEAMAAGLPLITSDYGPLPEVNVANETGLVVKAGASSELASAIHVLIEDPDLCSRFGLAGRCRARNCFAVEVMIDKMLGLYASVIAGTARKYGNMAR